MSKTRRPSYPARLACETIRFYQVVAPSIIRNACRFEPTCSDYALQVIARDGFCRGSLKTLERLHRCRPPHGGFDPP